MADKVFGFNERDAHNLIRSIGGSIPPVDSDFRINQTSINLYVFQLRSAFQRRGAGLGKGIFTATAAIYYPDPRGVAAFPMVADNVLLTDLAGMFANMINGSLGYCLHIHDLYVPIQGTCPADTSTT